MSAIRDRKQEYSRVCACAVKNA